MAVPVHIMMPYREVEV